MEFLILVLVGIAWVILYPIAWAVHLFMKRGGYL